MKIYNLEKFYYFILAILAFNNIKDFSANNNYSSVIVS